MEESGDKIQDMEVELEDSRVDFNNERLTKNAVELQNNLDQLRTKLDQLRAKKNAMIHPEYGMKDNFLYKEVFSDDLYKLTSERTETFLNFTSLQAAMRCMQTNQVLKEALEQQENSPVQLEPEEKQYVLELLEEQRELSHNLMKTQDQGSAQDLKIIEARTELASLLCKFQELRNEAGPVLLREEDKDKETQILEQSLNNEDKRLNQMRFIVQKLMIGQDKMGMVYDEETNARFKKIFLRLGMKPDDLRKEKIAQQ